MQISRISNRSIRIFSPSKKLKTSTEEEWQKVNEQNDNVLIKLSFPVLKSSSFTETRENAFLITLFMETDFVNVSFVFTEMLQES